MNDTGEEQILSNKQLVSFFQNDKFGVVNLWDIYQDLLSDEESNSSRIVSPDKITIKMKVLIPWLFLSLTIKIF